MISAPRISPLARPISASTPETIFVTKPSATAGDVSSAAVFASCSASSSTSSSSTAFSIAASTEPPISSVCWITPRTVAITTRVINARSPRTTRPAPRVGFSPRRFEVHDHGLEDHRQNRGEEQREHDLAHRREAGEHDDRRDDDPDEAPGPDAELGGRAHRRTALSLSLAHPAESVAEPRVPGHHPDRVRFRPRASHARVVLIRRHPTRRDARERRIEGS